MNLPRTIPDKKGGARAEPAFNFLKLVQSIKKKLGTQ